MAKKELEIHTLTRVPLVRRYRTIDPVQSVTKCESGKRERPDRLDRLATRPAAVRSPLKPKHRR